MELSLGQDSGQNLKERDLSLGLGGIPSWSAQASLVQMVETQLVLAQVILELSMDFILVGFG